LQSQYIELQKSGAGDSVKTNFKKNADAEVESYKQQIRTFIDTTHYNLAAMFAVSLLQLEKDVEVVNKLSERLQKTAPDSKYTKAYLKRYGNIVEDLVGKHFKEIELPGFDKKFKKLSSLKGKWILLDFWASWCPPCRRENPNVVSIYKKYKAKNFTIFSVSLDDNDGKWYDAAKADHLEWANHVSELKGWESKVCKDYYINQIPTNFLINPDGIIVAGDLHGEDLMKALEENVK
jgi:thiol-disulfide isomerase/thioredoxin